MKTLGFQGFLWLPLLRAKTDAVGIAYQFALQTALTGDINNKHKDAAARLFGGFAKAKRGPIPTLRAGQLVSDGGGESQVNEKRNTKPRRLLLYARHRMIKPTLRVAWQFAKGKRAQSLRNAEDY